MKILKSIYLISTITLSGQSLSAQVPDDIHSPYSKVIQKIGMTAIEITYSRPSLNGRSLYTNEFVPEGKEWRTGANAATTVRFDDPVLLNGEELKAGIYALYTVPSKDTWEIIFNANVYSEPFDGRIKESDILKLQLPVKKTLDKTETFTTGISNLSRNLTKGTLFLEWENTLIEIPLEVPKKWND